MMHSFWRDEILTGDERRLLEELYAAHHKSATRQNPSSVALQVAYQGSGSFTKGVVAALSSIGGPHGPIEATYDFLERGNVRRWLELGLKIPGWGSSFPLPDPDWEIFESCLANRFRNINTRIMDITTDLLEAGKVVLPNPSCFTAATAIAIGLPKHLSPILFIYGRLSAWGKLCL